MPFTLKKNMLSPNQKEVVLFVAMLIVVLSAALGYHSLSLEGLEDIYSQQIHQVRNEVAKNNQVLAYELQKVQEELKAKNRALEQQIRENARQLEGGITGKLTYLENQQRETLSDITKQLQSIQKLNGEKITLLEDELQSINVKTENYAPTIQKALLSVVTIDTLRGKASGFVVKSEPGKAWIVTSNHVIEQTPDTTKVAIVRTNQQKKYEAQVVGMNSVYDIALLMIEVQGETLAPLLFGDSNMVKVGDKAFALGNPGGFGVSVTEGIISATNRFVNGVPFIQTDSTINQGSSGGPLINKQGQVIGVNSLKIVGLEGVNLAIPSKLVEKIVSDLEQGRGYFAEMNQKQKKESEASGATRMKIQG